MKRILVHGLGHTAASWDKTISHMKDKEDILCPSLQALLNKKEANYTNLYASFAEYCHKANGPLALCGVSLGGILALQYALEHPDQVQSLVLIGTPCQMPKVLFGIQNMIFRLLPISFFKSMAFSKKDCLILGRSMKDLDFSSEVQNIQCKTLIICGKKDHANLKAAYYFSTHIRNSVLKTVENAGHVVNEETPDALAEILNEYYADVLSD